MDQIKVGTLLSYLKMIINVAVGLIYVPLILKYLSISQYGLYQLVASLVAYLAILDFGLSGTITRFYSQKLALGDVDGQQNVIAVSLIIYSIISVIILLLGTGFYFIMDSLYSGQLTSGELVIAKQMLILLIIDVALMVPSHVFTAIITAHEKFIFLRLSSIIRNLLQPVLIVFILMRYPTALAIVIIQIILDLLIILVTILYALRAFHVRIKLNAIDKSLIKNMLSFSFFIFINIIVDQVYWGTGQLVLGAVVGTTSVAIFSIAIQFNNYFRQFSTAIISVLLPKITRMATVSNRMEEINQEFFKISRIQFIILSLLLSGFIIFGKTFIKLWVGNEFSQAYLMTLVIMIPFVLDLVTSMGNLILQAKNLHSRRSLILTISATINVGLSITLSFYYGALGCAIAIGVSLLLGNGITMLVYYERIGLRITMFFKELKLLVLSVILSTIIGWIGVRLVRINSWFILLVGILLYCIIFSIITWLIGLNLYEKKLLRRIINPA
ncbi:lipopolysaccharide biosynthesis protein [Pleomorphochaeta sp. DL1XJH-081]|uniref:lipopolysaccharide biosynthesis protein n=1 Tax=Pleomorphochaeta sp. DL1XJH-081 TaxID=3409690 RepID=UPI003BB4CE63